ncbi:DUF3649 domain-containing protein (plasmid) [Acidovorax sp. DW039]|nr:DUF3649 domain-containing protein [Acidovorax sp. DW039]
MVGYRLVVALRVVLAVVGGYALASAFAACAGLLLVWGGSSRVDAVLWSTMLAFLVHAIAALWVFGCRNSLRALLGVFAPLVMMSAALLMVYGVRQ